MKDSAHFQDMLKERQIKLDWADRAIREPDGAEDHGDEGTRHIS
jgi:hypothetical protein